MIMIKCLYSKHLIQQKNTESTERRKTSFLTEIVENADLYQTRIKQNNDNTRTMCKIRFCSSFKLVAEGGEFSRNIKKGRSQTFYKSIVVHSVTHAIGESVSSISMFSYGW